jgi:hypothetical protein
MHDVLCHAGPLDESRPWESLGDSPCFQLRFARLLHIALSFSKAPLHHLLVGIFVFYLTYGMALARWPGGNDGGGFFWILVGFPTCFLTSIGYLVLSVLAWPTDPTPRPPGTQECVRDVLELTPFAAENVLRLSRQNRMPPDTAVRIAPDAKDGHKCQIKFDLPESDGRQWIGCSQGITILVDKGDASSLSGTIVDFRDGEFVIIEYNNDLGV